MPAITADYSSSFPSVIFVKEKKKKKKTNQGLLIWFCFAFFSPFLKW